MLVRFLSIGAVLVGCGKETAEGRSSGKETSPEIGSPAERRAEAADHQRRVRKQWFDAKLTTRGASDEVLVLGGLEREVCSQELLRMLSDSTTKQGVGEFDLARVLAVGFRRIECETGAGVVGIDIPSATPTADELRARGRYLRKRYAADGVYRPQVGLYRGIKATTLGPEDETLMIQLTGKCDDTMIDGVMYGFNPQITGTNLLAGALGFTSVRCEGTKGNLERKIVKWSE